MRNGKRGMCTLEFKQEAVRLKSCPFKAAKGKRRG